MLDSNNPPKDYKDFLIRLRKDHAAIISRIDAVLEELDRPALTIEEAVTQFITAKCTLDPDKAGDYRLIYNAFTLFKSEQGIKTKILKSVFFAELESRGHTCFRGLYRDQPDHAISGIYLTDRPPRPVEEPDKEYAGMTPAEIVDATLARTEAAELIEESKRFEEAMIRGCSEEDPAQTKPKTEKRLFDF